MILITKIYEPFGSENRYIVSYNFSGASKTRQNVSFKKLDDDRVNRLPAWYNLDPLGEVVCGREDPLVLARGGRMYFTNEV